MHSHFRRKARCIKRPRLSSRARRFGAPQQNHSTDCISIAASCLQENATRRGPACRLSSNRRPQTATNKYKRSSQKLKIVFSARKGMDSPANFSLAEPGTMKPVGVVNKVPLSSFKLPQIPSQQLADCPPCCPGHKWGANNGNALPRRPGIGPFAPGGPTPNSRS